MICHCSLRLRHAHSSRATPRPARHARRGGSFYLGGDTASAVGATQPPSVAVRGAPCRGDRASVEATAESGQRAHRRRAARQPDGLRQPHRPPRRAAGPLRKGTCLSALGYCKTANTAASLTSGLQSDVVPFPHSRYLLIQANLRQPKV